MCAFSELHPCLNFISSSPTRRASSWDLLEPLSGDVRSEIWLPWHRREKCCTVREADRQTDRQLQQEGKLPFQLQGAYVRPTRGPSGSPPSKLCPGRSNKTPGLLRCRHSSCLGSPFPSKATPEINRERFIRGLGGKFPTTSGGPFVSQPELPV